MENRENKNRNMYVTYKLSTKGVRELFIKTGVYKSHQEKRLDIFFDPLELSQKEREILFDNTDEGIFNNQRYYNFRSLDIITDIHKFIEIID